MYCGLERDALGCWSVVTRWALNVRADACDSPLPWGYCTAVGEWKLFSRPGWQDATFLQGQPESFMHLKDLHQSHRDLPLLQMQELRFSIKNRESILLPPCPAFAGNGLLLKPRVSFHPGQPHPCSQSSMHSYPSPGIPTAALRVDGQHCVLHC